MTIAQVVTTLPAAPDPATMTRDQFSAAAAAYVIAQKAMVPELNTWAGEVNAIAATAVGDVATAIGAAGVDTPVDVDHFGWRQAATGLLKKTTWANIKATLKTYFDGFYAAKGANTDITSLSALTEPTGNRNKIINGNMGIFQRGTTAVTTSGNYGPADRWLSLATGDTFSTSQGSFVSGDTLFGSGGAKYYTSVAVTSVTNVANQCYIQQRIEDVRLLAGKTVTVSFWAKAAAGTPLIGVEAGQNFGAGGSSSETGTGQAITLSTTWAKYSKSITMPSLSGKTVGTDATHFTFLNVWLDAGSDSNTRSGTIGQASKTVSIAQVQLEAGSVATPFEHRPIGTELALCQRYYEKSFLQSVAPATAAGDGGASIWLCANAGATTSYSPMIMFQTTKRATNPTLVFYNPSRANAYVINLTRNTDATATATALITPSERGFVLQHTGLAPWAVGDGLGINWTADAEL